jgi:hypothetical protein
LNTTGKRAALYINAPHGSEKDVIQQAHDYCREYGYTFNTYHIYQDTNAMQPSLVWLKDAMDNLAFHVVLVPSLSHINTHMGRVLNFLQDAPDCQIEVVCLDPIPTSLLDIGFVPVPLDTTARTAGIASVANILQCLRIHWAKVRTLNGSGQ